MLLCMLPVVRLLSTVTGPVSASKDTGTMSLSVKTTPASVSNTLALCRQQRPNLKINDVALASALSERMSLSFVSLL